MDRWTVYILVCADGSFYTGISKDLEKRIKVHNSGKGAKYTRGRLPVKLLWSEQIDNEGDARRKEILIKKMSRKEKEKMINSFS